MGGGGELAYTHTLYCDKHTIGTVTNKTVYVGYLSNLFGALVANTNQSFELFTIPQGIYTLTETSENRITFDFSGEKKPFDQGYSFYFGFSDTKQYLGMVNHLGNSYSTEGYIDTEFSLKDQSGKTRKIWLANTPPPLGLAVTRLMRPLLNGRPYARKRLTTKVKYELEWFKNLYSVCRPDNVSDSNLSTKNIGYSYSCNRNRPSDNAIRRKPTNQPRHFRGKSTLRHNLHRGIEQFSGGQLGVKSKRHQCGHELRKFLVTAIKNRRALFRQYRFLSLDCLYRYWRLAFTGGCYA